MWRQPEKQIPYISRVLKTKLMGDFFSIIKMDKVEFVVLSAMIRAIRVLLTRSLPQTPHRSKGLMIEARVANAPRVVQQSQTL
jgi:hypothetical protein